MTEELHMQLRIITYIASHVSGCADHRLPGCCNANIYLGPIALMTIWLVTLFNGQWEQKDEDNEPMGRKYSGNVTVTMTKMRCCVGDVTNIQDIELICVPLVTYYYTSVTQSRQSSDPWKWGMGGMTMKNLFLGLWCQVLWNFKCSTFSVEVRDNLDCDYL